MIDRIKTYALTIAVFGVAILAALLKIQSLKQAKRNLQAQNFRAEHEMWTKRQQEAQQRINQRRKEVVMKQLEDVRNGKAPRDHFE